MFQQIGSVIAFHRKRSGLTRKELAKLAGVGTTVIFHIEHGKNTVRIDTLYKLLRALNIRINLESPLMKEYESGLS